MGIPRADQWIVSGLLLGFLSLRMLALRTTPLLYFDSRDYLHLELWGGRRPFTVPLLFWLVPSDSLRVVEQAAISVFAWTALALVVAAGLEDRRVRLGSVVALLALGSTTQVTNWDTTILSDSIAISLTVLLVAAWIAVYRSPSRWSVAGVLAVTLLWTFTRELHVYVTALVALVVVGAVAVKRASALWWVTAASLLFVATLGFFESRANEETSKQNLAGVIGARILPNQDARAWFIDAGMPPMPQLADGRAHPDNELLAIPEFDRWANEGWPVYARYLVTHPTVAIDGPFRELLEERPAYSDKSAGKEVLLSPADAYGRARPVLPGPVEDVLFAPARTGALLTLAVGTLAAALVVHARLGRDRRRHVPIALVGAALLYVGLSWHGSVFEPGRHAMPAAVAIRIGLIALLGVVIDRIAVASAR
ncbi:MAG: hypothetical protein QOD38_149 [Acidimicrobiaceae bacterium]